MSTKKVKLKLWAKISIIVLAVILFLSAALFGARCYFMMPVKDYYQASQKAFLIPDIDNGFIPQGIDYDKSSDCFFISGYHKSHSSPVYLLDKASGKYKTIYLLDENGANYDGHSGGIAVYNKFVYVADGTGILVYSYNDMIKAEDGATVNCQGKFSTKFSDTDYIRCSFIDVTDNKLIVGEFYREQNYQPLSSHKITTASGDYNQAFAVEFSLSTSSTYKFGIKPTPQKAYSLPDKVQGMTLESGKFYLSQSYGLSFSNVQVHDKNKAKYVESITLLGESVSLYSLDTNSKLYDYKLPPMSGELVFVSGYMYVMSESASNKYIFGKLTNAKSCFKTDVNKLNP